MTHHVSNQFDDTSWQQAGRGIGGHPVFEQRRAAMRVPRYVVGWDLRCQKPARRIAQAGKVRAGS